MAVARCATLGQTGRLAALALSLAAMLLAGCATRLPLTPALPQVDPLSGYRFTMRPKAEDNSTGLFVVLTFSGGGSRAAALAHGVMEALAEVDISWDGQRRRLLDEVDAISAVSGGSVTAAYYALHGNRLFEDFAPRFLHQDVQGLLLQRFLNPVHWPRRWGRHTGRSDLLADILDELLFDGAT